MDTYLFSLLVQAAGTVLLFIVFLLLYQKFRRPAFLDWIASWGFFLASIGVLAVSQAEGWRKVALPVLEVALLGHVFFLLRGVWRFRREETVSRPVEMLWAIPILVVSWGFSIVSVPEAPPRLPARGGVPDHGARLRADSRLRGRSRHPVLVLLPLGHGARPHGVRLPALSRSVGDARVLRLRPLRRDVPRDDGRRRDHHPALRGEPVPAPVRDAAAGGVGLAGQGDGNPRPADRPLQPPLLQRRHPPRARAVSPPRRRALGPADRRGPLQGDQRRARPRRSATACSSSSRTT